MSKKVNCWLCGGITADPRISKYDGKPPICNPCHYAENMLDIKDACMYHEGKNAEQCGYSIEKWRSLVLGTRRTTTDKYLRETKVLKGEAL